MLDLKLIRDDPEKVSAGTAKKKHTLDVDAILKLDEQRREIIHQVEKLKGERNRVSGEIAQKKKAGESADDAIAAMRQVGEQVSALDGQLNQVDADLRELLAAIPNLPHEAVPVGFDEADNRFVRQWGQKPEPAFDVKPHWEIGEKLGILDMAAGAAISGSGFAVLKGGAASLQRALINYMLDMHTTDGFTEVIAPYLVNSDTMFGTGQLPKLADDMYRVEADDLWLIPTAEVPLTNLYKRKIVNEEELPISLVAHSPCFRREAGAAGKDTRGMNRIHQFDKVEMVRIVHPEESYDALEALTLQAEKVLQGLNLHYRVMELATGDLSFAAAKTYDLEIWAAGVQKYLEISSVTNYESFQARRMNLRFRNSERKTEFPHTLNGSGLALPRLMTTIMENYQNEDGSLTVPDVLRPYLNGADRIK